MDDYLMPHIQSYSHQNCMINIPADVLERCDSNFDIREFSHLALLRAILAIRACGGRYKRAQKNLEEIGIPVPIVVYVVKKICKILSCGNLDTAIPHEDTIRAFDQFLQLQHHPDAYFGHPNSFPWSPNSQNNFDYAPQTNHNASFHGMNQSNFLIEDREMGSYSNSNSNKLGSGRAGGHLNASVGNNSFSYSRPVTGGIESQPPTPLGKYFPENHYKEFGRTDSFREEMFQHPPFPAQGYSSNFDHNIMNEAGINREPSPEIPFEGDILSNIYVPERPADIHLHILQLLLPEVNVDALLARDPSAVNNLHSRANVNKSRQSSIAVQPDISSLCQLFWILSICVFITVCDDRQSISESLVRLHELCRFVGSGNSDLLTMSPVLGVALDVIVQRAVYELSDKISLQASNSIMTDLSTSMNDYHDSKPFGLHNLGLNSQIDDETDPLDVYSQPQMLYDNIHSDSPHTKDLYKCISLMLHSVTDSCIRIESSFLPGQASTPSMGPENDAFMTSSNYSRSKFDMSNAFGSTQTSMNSRTQKLAKQLREALAWSSCKDQLPLESFAALSKLVNATSVASVGQIQTLSNQSGLNANNNTEQEGQTEISSNLTSRASIDVHDLYLSKCRSADQALNQVVNPPRTFDMINHDIEMMRNRLNSIFALYPTEPGTEFNDCIVDLGGLSGTSLLPYLYYHMNQGANSMRSNASSNLNNLRSSNLISQPPQGLYGSANGDVEFVLNVPSFNNKIQSFKNQITGLQNKLNTFNDILRIDTTIENCLKHIKACIKEARNQIGTYCNDLQSYSQVYAKKFFAMGGPSPLSPSGQVPLSPYGNPYSGRNSGRRNESAFDISAKIARIRAEMETLCGLGDKLIAVMGNNLRSLRSNGVVSAAASAMAANVIGNLRNNGPIHIDSNPIVSNDFETLSRLPLLLQSRRFVVDEITKLSDNETSDLKRYLKVMEQVLRESNFPSVKLVVRPKHPGIRYGPIACVDQSGQISSRGSNAGAPLSRTITPPFPLSGPYSGGPLTKSISPPNQFYGAPYPGAPLSRQLSPTGVMPGAPLSRTTSQSYPIVYLVTINDSGVIDPYHQISTFYNQYCNYDKTNKIRNYLACIIHFAKVHTLCDPDNGTLALEGWLVLAIHVLLHYDIVPNLHEEINNASSPTESAKNVYDGNSCSRENISPSDCNVSLNSSLTISTLPAQAISKPRIDEVSLIGLLELFFRYLTEEFDILGSIITVRGKGEQIPKHQWRIDPPVMWRLCIEDPFERAMDNCSKPLDLGATLTRPGQIQLFKAIRRAAFGVNAIIIKDIGDTEKYVRMLFHKDDLLALSRLSGYNGAAVITTPIYIPNPNRKSKLVYVWVSDKTLHAPIDSAAVTRHCSTKELIPRDASRHDSGNSLLEDLSIETNVNRHLGNNASNSFTLQSSTTFNANNLHQGYDETIRLVDDVDYVDSDDEDSPGKLKSLPNRSQAGNNMSNSKSMRDNVNFGPTSPEYRQNHNISSNSLTSVDSLSPHRRPPAGPGSLQGSMGLRAGNSNPGIYNQNFGPDMYYGDRNGSLGYRGNVGRGDDTPSNYRVPYPSPAVNVNNYSSELSFNQDMGYGDINSSDMYHNDRRMMHQPFQPGRVGWPGASSGRGTPSGIPPRGAVPSPMGTNRSMTSPKYMGYPHEHSDEITPPNMYGSPRGFPSMPNRPQQTTPYIPEFGRRHTYGEEYGEGSAGRGYIPMHTDAVIGSNNPYPSGQGPQSISRDSQPLRDGSYPRTETKLQPYSREFIPQSMAFARDGRDEIRPREAYNSNYSEQFNTQYFPSDNRAVQYSSGGLNGPSSLSRGMSSSHVSPRTYLDSSAPSQGQGLADIRGQSLHSFESKQYLRPKNYNIEDPSSFDTILDRYGSDSFSFGGRRPDNTGGVNDASLSHRSFEADSYLGNNDSYVNEQHNDLLSRQRLNPAREVTVTTNLKLDGIQSFAQGLDQGPSSGRPLSRLYSSSSPKAFSNVVSPSQYLQPPGLNVNYVTNNQELDSFPKYDSFNFRENPSISNSTFRQDETYDSLFNTVPKTSEDNSYF